MFHTGSYRSYGSGIAMLTTEIADLTGKRHRDVMRDTRKMLVDLLGQAGLLDPRRPAGTPKASRSPATASQARDDGPRHGTTSTSAPRSADLAAVL
jgi:hypothetical protein